MTSVAQALLARLSFASVEFVLLAAAAAALLRWIRPAPRTAALCWAAVLLKPIVALAIGSPLPVWELSRSDERSVARAAAAPDSLASGSLVSEDAALRPAPSLPIVAKASTASEPQVAAASQPSAPLNSPLPPRPDPAPTTSSSRIGVALVLFAWLAGVAGMLARSLCDRVRRNRLLARCGLPSGRLVAIAERAARLVGLQALPPLRVTSELASPAIVGVARPTVLVPAWMEESGAPWMLRWSLRHELAHLRHRDLLLLLLREAAQVLFFFHPATWFCARRLELELELACDRAIVRGPLQARAYARQLVAIRDRAAGDATRLVRGAYAVRARLLDRVRALVQEPGRLGARASGVARLLPLPLLLAALVGARLQARPATPGPGESAMRGEAPADEIRGRVVDASGKPFANAKVRLFQARSTMAWLDPSTPNYVEFASATTDAQGAFGLRGSPGDRDETITLMATAPGMVPSWTGVIDGRVSALHDKTLVLSADDTPVEGRLIDLEGRPVAGANIRVDFASALDGIAFGEFERRLAGGAPSPDSFRNFHWSVAPIEGATLETQTDEEGRFRLSGFGRDRFLHLRLFAEGCEYAQADVFTHPGLSFPPPRGPSAAMTMMADEFGSLPQRPRYGPRFTHALAPEQRITGVVVDEQTGEPIPDCKVFEPATEGICDDLTDAEGRFALSHLRRTRQDRFVAVRPPSGLSFTNALLRVAPQPSLAPVELRIPLARGIPLHGRVLDPATGKGARVSLGYTPFADNPNAQLKQWRIDDTSTDADGRYRIVIPPGPGFLAVHAGGPNVREFCAARLRDVRTDGKPPKIGSGGALGMEATEHEFRFVDPAPGTKELELDISLRRGKTLTLHVLDREGQPARRLTLYGQSPCWAFAQEIDGPDATVFGLEPGSERDVLLLDEATASGASVHLAGDETGTVEVALKPCAWITGRVVDEEGGRLAGFEFESTLRMGNALFGVAASTIGSDAQGAIRAALIPGVTYTLQLADASPLEIALASGEVKDLGELRITEETLRGR